MAQPQKLAKAQMQGIKWNEAQEVEELGHELEVQFNPETLKLSYANQISWGDQRGGAATQFTAKGTTKLSMELWFDVSAGVPAMKPALTGDVNDVRKLTDRVNWFMRPHDDLGGAPPGVRILWGTFKFDGVIESMNENLDLFSEDGRPLRASVSLGLSQQEIKFEFGKQSAGNIGSTGGPGTTANQLANAGDSVQDIAARAGSASDWQELALRNGIENPRIIVPGTVIEIG